MSTTQTGAPEGAAQLAGRMAELSGEGALDVFTRARALEARGRTVAHLELGEPDFPTPPHIVDAGVRAIRDGQTRYSAPAGLPELRQAIADTVARRGIHAEPGEVLVTPGAKPMVFYAALAVIEPGDEALVPDPGFPIYPSVTRFAGGVPVSYGLVEGARFAPDVDEIATRITPRTRVLFLNAPQNPSGGSLDSVVLERLADLVLRHDLTVISDEVYGRIVYGDGADDTDGSARAPSIAALDGLRERTLVVDGFSKAYAMTGWRLGFGIIPRPLVERLTTLAVNGHTCTPMFVQRAGIAALTGPDEPVREMVAEYRRRRDLLVPGLAALPGVSCPLPSGAFYAFPNLSAALAPAGLSGDDFATRLLDDFGVAALTGTAFGARGDGHLRISFAASREVIQLALERIRECLESLTPAGAR